MKVYKTKSGIVVETDGKYFVTEEDWDSFINRDDLYSQVREWVKGKEPAGNGADLIKNELLPPLGSQEIWASGVTYYKSREARMEEASEAGGGDFYDRVYHAERPELFFKSTPGRAAGPGEQVRIRKDSSWNVPEPELTLVISSSGNITGYTIGNDMSSRDIEGENPLYLPQAKSYDKSAAVGPCIYITEEPLPEHTTIKLEILRDGNIAFEGTTQIDQIKREFAQLVHYLYLETTFPEGALLMTGTGIVPSDEFTLNHGDEIRITIDHIGTLVNSVE
ncbi:MAG: fumarylacetoacetate hydrolase family protein [Balneolaceae bacterium]